MSPADLCAVQAHATGTSLGDLAEARALRRSLGGRRRSSPVSSPPRASSAICWGAAGAVETILALQALLPGEYCQAAINADPLDPEVELAVTSQKYVKEQFMLLAQRLMLKTPSASAVTTSASCCCSR